MDETDDIETRLRRDRGRINCPKGLDADYTRKVCRNCGRSIMYVRRSRIARAHWQHVSDMAGIRWYREARHLAG